MLSSLGIEEKDFFVGALRYSGEVLFTKIQNCIEEDDERVVMDKRKLQFVASEYAERL